MLRLFCVGITAALLMLCNITHAFEIYPLTDTERCSSITTIGLTPVLDKVIYTNPDTKTHPLNNEVITGMFVSGFGVWRDKFQAANDIILLQEPTFLCTGLYFDGNAPNAQAYDKTHIVFGANFLTSFLHRPGINSEVALKFTMAHEFSHFLQNRHNLVFEYKLPMLSTKVKELHADCMAGYLLTLGQELNDYEFNQAMNYLGVIADPHIILDHGIAPQRRSAFLYGRNSAIFDLNTGHTELKTTSGDIIFACKKKYSWTR